MSHDYDPNEAQPPTMEILSRAVKEDVDRHWAKTIIGSVLTIAGVFVCVWLIMHEKAALHTERQFLLESGVGVALLFGGSVYLAPNFAVALLNVARNLLPWTR